MNGSITAYHYRHYRFHRMAFSNWIGQTRTPVVADIKSTCHPSYQNRFLTYWQLRVSARPNDRSLHPSLIVNGIECSFSTPVIADISGAGCFTVFLTFYGRAISPWTTVLRVTGIVAAKRYDIPLIMTITFVELVTNAKIDTVPIIHHPNDDVHTSLLSLVQRLKHRQMSLRGVSRCKIYGRSRLNLVGIHRRRICGIKWTEFYPCRDVRDLISATASSIWTWYLISIGY